MARNSRRYKGRGSSSYRTRPPQDSERTPMLNLSKISDFRFDIKEIMRRHNIEDTAASSVMASVIAKGSRISIDSARAYVREQEKTGAYPREALDEICNLLTRFSKLR